MDQDAAWDRCGYFENLFSPYIDGSLDAPERKALAEHLHDCEGCAEQFGLTWRKVASQASAGSTPPTGRPRRRNSNTGLWLLALLCLSGVVVLGAMGLLDTGGGGSSLDLFQSRTRGKLQDQLAEMVSVQTDLMKALVGPLRDEEPTVTHAARGEAKDYFERLTSRRGQEEGDPMWEADLHPLFRAADPAPGGRDWSRREFVEKLNQGGLPPVLLVRVVSAFRDVIFCQVTWGERPAYAWLLREAPQAEREIAFRLGYLLFSRP